MEYFDDPNSKHFSFESFATDLAEDTFGVINFKGYEAISKTYDFEVMLVSSNKDIDLESVLQSQAVFTIHRGADDDVLYNGIVAEFDQLHEVNDVIFYRARLVPKLWWLTLTHHNQVFLNQSVVDFVEDALRDGGLESSGFDVSGLSTYEDIDYTCQYDESHFNFVSRWLERQGIYYYFAQEPDGEVLTLTDTKFSHEALKQGADLFYNPASGLEGKHLGEAIGGFTCRQKQLPAEIILKDYNYERPSLDITSRADADPGGRGISYIYGEYFSTSEDGERLANIRAEELLCQKQEFFGESTVPYIMPGFTFNMNNHYREDFNQEYLILEVTHEGNQSHLMSGGIASDAGESQNQAIYHNSFKAMPNDVQYRPERVTEKPKISGTIHAKIDSEVDSEYAQIDEQGRYHVRLPFDINDEHMDGKGSAPIRMMQSYAGKNRGMQFPLVKGTEVLLTFIEGNPDRPIIAGAVSNPETQGPVNANNLSESVIQTGGNNKIRMEDKSGRERMVFESPASNSWIRVGTKNDPPILNGSSGFFLEEGAVWADPGAKVKVYSQDKPSLVATYGNDNVFEADAFSGYFYAYDDVFSAPADITLNSAVTAWDGASTQIGNWQFTYRTTDPDGTEETALRSITVYDNTATTVDGIGDNLSDDSDGIRIRTAGNLWMESKSRYAEYIHGTPAIASLPRKASTQAATDPNQLGDIRDFFIEKYRPTGMLNYNTKAAQDSFKKDVLADAHVKLSSFDTVNTQEGNIYDFGGYWNYNLGNSYAENHIDQCAELNKKHDSTLSGPDAEAIAWAVAENAASFIAPLIMPGVVAVTGAVQGGPGGALASGFIVGAALPVFAIGSTVLGLSLKYIVTPILSPSMSDVIAGPGSGDIKTWANKVAMHTDTAWVEKKFGDAYNYTKGNTIDIFDGNSEVHTKGDVHEYKYGGKSSSTSFSKGKISSHSSSGGGHKIAANWDSTSGQFQSFEYKFKNFFTFSVTMPTVPKIAVSVAMSTLDAKIAVSMGTSFSFKLAAAVAFDISLAAGFYAKFERKVGGELTWNEVTGEREFKAFGLKAAKEAAMKAKKQTLIMDKVTTSMDIKDICLINSKLRNEEYKLKTNMGNTFFL
ncbi:MAG: type VI secretion system tip protein VgrG [Gammaproteobacteria bacterium]|nr:type VI secretion system tip protein VgrG [Gammaproteobacteria bacterium]